MNPNCPYCQNSARYDLEPAEELETVSTTYERAEGEIAAKATHRKVRVMGHRFTPPDRRAAAFPCGVPESMKLLKPFGQVAYEAFGGEPLEPWESLEPDEQAAWEAAAQAVMDAYDETYDAF